MTLQRTALYGLLSIVAAAAAVLSFAALRDLALMCGFDEDLAWLLPVTIDAGAAASSYVWLASWTPAGASSYGRTLALLLLGSSVGGNALGHGLAAYSQQPHWLVVVGVSAIAPAVLGALVHLVVLVGRPVEDQSDSLDRDDDGVDALIVKPGLQDAQIVADLREWAVDLGRRPTWKETTDRYVMGGQRARRIRNMIGWIEPVEDPSTTVESVVR